MEELMDFDEAIVRLGPVVGFEVHVEPGIEMKMFDGAPSAFGEDTDTYVTPASLGFPGSFPIISAKAMECAVKIGLALDCSVVSSCRSARKNYFYPDLTKAFQIPQSDEPVAYEGHLDISLSDGSSYRFPVERAHTEEDAGKNAHVGGAEGGIQGADYSLMDYNRTGVSLVEIVSYLVTGVGMKAPQVTASCVCSLHDVFRAPGVSETKMERGSVRVDINVSLRGKPSAPFGTCTETKNVNSFRGVENATRYEICRQAVIPATGGTVVQETHHYCGGDGTTSTDRVKSDAEDYRYFPELGPAPVVPDPTWAEEFRADIPESPAAKRHHVEVEWELSGKELRGLVNADVVDLAEVIVAAGASPSGTRKWWMGDIAQYAKGADVELRDAPTTPPDIIKLDGLVHDGKLTDRLACQVFEGVFVGEGAPSEAVSVRGLEIVSDDGALVATVDEVLATNPGVAERIRSGEVQVTGAIVGAVMKATSGKANAARVYGIVMEYCQ